VAEEVLKNIAVFRIWFLSVPASVEVEKGELKS